MSVRMRGEADGVGALAPILTAYDLRVLKAVPLEPDWTTFEADAGWPCLSVWQIAEALKDDDVAGIRRVLHGLNDRGFAYRLFGGRLAGKWTRSPRGDAYLRERAA